MILTAEWQMLTTLALCFTHYWMTSVSDVTKVATVWRHTVITCSLKWRHEHFYYVIWVISNDVVKWRNKISFITSSLAWTQTRRIDLFPSDQILKGHNSTINRVILAKFWNFTTDEKMWPSTLICCTTLLFNKHWVPFCDVINLTVLHMDEHCECVVKPLVSVQLSTVVYF